MHQDENGGQVERYTADLESASWFRSKVRGEATNLSDGGSDDRISTTSFLFLFFHLRLLRGFIRKSPVK